MPIVSIRHRTSYRYRNPVAFGEHRLMLRPQEGFDQRLLDFELDVSPQPALLRHLHDLTDAGVAIARFEARADALVVESRALVDHRPHAALDLEAADATIDAGAFSYDADEGTALAASIAPRHADGGEVEAWARRFLRPVGRTRLSTLLGQMTHAVRADFDYGVREAGPPQSPEATLQRRHGSCRDFAVLMIEAARRLGLAARFASGYVYGDGQKAGGKAEGASHGHTHAWVRVYLPGCGWADFDPTNGIVGGAGLIRVAAAPDPKLTLPLHGAWRGMRADFLGMEVEVDIDVQAAAAAQPPPRLRVAATG
jgi:transglutaminase-like putative cysteine protease